MTLGIEDKAGRRFRLSPPQRRLWPLAESGWGGPWRCLLRIQGEVDRGLLRCSLQALVARHEILRTGGEVLAGMPVQVVHEPGPMSLPELDFRELDARGRERALDELFGATDRGLPLLECALARLGNAEQALLLTLPALCGDPSTLRLLAEELARACSEGSPGQEAEPPMQYADIAEWLNELLEIDETAEAREAWRRDWQERAIPELLTQPLPLEERGSDESRGAGSIVAVPVEVGRKVREGIEKILAARGTSSAEELLLACWQVLLWRSTGRPEVLVGVLRDGRRHVELREAVGPLSRYVPVCSRLDGVLRFGDLLSAVREALDEVAPREEYFNWRSLPEIAEDFFPVCFASREPWCFGSRFRLFPIRERGAVDRFKLELSCRGLDLELRYDRRFFRREAVDLLAARMSALLRNVAARPDAPLAELQVLGEGEIRKVLMDFVLGLPAAPPEGSLQRLFEEQVERSPERPAILWERETWTYAALNERANRLAHHLRALGVGPETPVGLCLARSPEAVAAVLAVLKAGGAWVPLDPSHPPARLNLLLEEAGTRVVVVRGELPGLPDPGRVARVCLEADAPTLAGRPATNLPDGAGPENLGYVIYTSGSTGKPKGVLIEHRSPAALLAALEKAVLAGPELHAPLRASLNAPLSFDASVQQLVLLLSGHTLIPVPDEVRTDGPALLAFLREQEIDLFDCTPTQLRLLVGAGLLDAPPPVPRIVLVAGEAIDPALWDALRRSERTAFYNLYGPTECTVDATAHRIADDGAPTLGRPLPGYEAYVLDALLRPVPVRVAGELCLGGCGLARGYLGRPAETAERFVPDPSGRRAGGRLYRTGDLARHRMDGSLEFLGRIDQQLKIRGYRIEPGEIEAVLRGHPAIREAAVVARVSAPGETELVAYVLPASAAPIPPGLGGELSRFLRERLPVHLIPAACVPLEAFPLTPGGKVDRRALSRLPRAVEPAASGMELAAVPRNPVEDLLLQLWHEVFARQDIGLHDDFFGLGGHSLLATQLAARVRRLFQVDLKVKSLFETPTVAGLAQVIAAAGSGSEPDALPLRSMSRQGELPLSYAQQRLWFLHQLDPGSAAYNLSLGVRLGGLLHLAALAAAFREVVRRHEILRTAFPAAGGRPVQKIAEPGPIRLPLVDLEELGAAAVETARQIARAEVRRPFDLESGPLFRPLLLRLGLQDHVLLLAMHHIIGDAWSTGVLVRELTALYETCRRGEPSRLPEPALQYADFAVWQRAWLQGEVLEAQLAWWRARLAGSPELLCLPTDHPRPARQSSRGGRQSFQFSAGLSAEIRELARGEGCTVFMALLAGFHAFLSHWSGEEDVVTGSPIACRDRVEIEALVGVFLNTLLLRNDLSGDSTFRDLLGRTRNLVLEAFGHRHVPFDELVAELRPERSLAYNPLFQVGFNFQAGTREDRSGIPGITVGPFDYEPGTVQLDLNLNMLDSPSLYGELEYSRDLFEEPTIAWVPAQLQRLFQVVVDDPEIRLSGLRKLLSEADRTRWGEVGRGLGESRAESFRNRKRQAVSARC